MGLVVPFSSQATFMQRCRKITYNQTECQKAGFPDSNPHLTETAAGFDNTVSGKLSEVLKIVDIEAWQKEVLYGEGQNLAHLLMEAPANHITPTAFANTIEEQLASYTDPVKVHKSGGISLKLSSGMDAMRADMGGAATMCASIMYLLCRLIIQMLKGC